MIHGTRSTYVNHGCRCDECKAANAARSRAIYHGERLAPLHADEARFADLLHELAPDGLTDDCPARRAA